MLNNTELLKSYHLKVTPQRVAIIEELVSHGHMNIEELYQALTKRFPSISLATIYKNINAMVEKDFVQEVKIPEQKSKFELTKESHAHVVCRECRKVEDIVVGTEAILGEVKDLSHYQIEKNDLVFTGLCPECLEKQSA